MLLFSEIGFCYGTEMLYVAQVGLGLCPFRQPPGSWYCRCEPRYLTQSIYQRRNRRGHLRFEKIHTRSRRQSAQISQAKTFVVSVLQRFEERINTMCREILIDKRNHAFNRPRESGKLLDVRSSSELVN